MENPALEIGNRARGGIGWGTNVLLLLAGSHAVGHGNNTGIQRAAVYYALFDTAAGSQSGGLALYSCVDWFSWRRVGNETGQRPVYHDGSATYWRCDILCADQRFLAAI